MDLGAALKIAVPKEDPAAGSRLCAAARSIGDSATPVLGEVLRASKGHHQVLAAAMLGRIGEGAIPVLMEALYAEGSLSTCGGTMLGLMGDPGIKALGELAESNNEHLEKAVVALTKAGPPAIPVLSRLLMPEGGRHPSGKFAGVYIETMAMLALGKIGGPSVPVLEKFIETNPSNPLCGQVRNTLAAISLAGGGSL